MAEPFDPYYQWLGIHPDDQPPNLYQLIGVSLFESNPDVIESSAHRQIAHVRTFALGQHSSVSQKLLSELSRAKLLLMDPARRAAYDTSLKAKLAAEEQEAPRPAVRQVKHPAPAQRPVTVQAPLIDDFLDPPRPQIRTSRPSAKRKQQIPLMVSAAIGGGIGLAALAVLALLVFVLRSSPDLDPVSAVASRQPATSNPFPVASGSGQSGTSTPGSSQSSFSELVSSVGPSISNTSLEQSSGGFALIALLWPETYRKGATITIDGVMTTLRSAKSITPALVAFEVAPGDHRVQIRWADGKEYMAIADCAPDQQRELDVRVVLPSQGYTAQNTPPLSTPSPTPSPTPLATTLPTPRPANTTPILPDYPGPALLDATYQRTAADVEDAQLRWADFLGQGLVKNNSLGMKFTLVPPGEFLQGMPETDPRKRGDAVPQHPVRLTRPIYMGTHEVTQAQWESVMGTRPWQGQRRLMEGANYPATSVSWDDAQEFCRRLSEAEQVRYRLPSEAEWEYACRAGTTTRYFFGEDSTLAQHYAWLASSASREFLHEVGQKSPNWFGLCDMQGNVSEWCEEWHSSGYYRQFTSLVIDPLGPPHRGELGRVVRGASWNHSESSCDSAYRMWNVPKNSKDTLGFRVVLDVASDQLPELPDRSVPDDSPQNRSSFRSVSPRTQPVVSKEPGTPLPKGTWYEMLPAVDLETDVVGGSWQPVAGDGLLADAARYSRLMLPFRASGSYDLRVNFIRKGGDDCIGVLIPVHDRNVMLVVDGWPILGGYSFLNEVDGKNGVRHPDAFRGKILQPGRPYQFDISVRVGGAVEVTLKIDKQKIFTWNGRPEQLAVLPGWRVPDDQAFAICAYDVPVEFSSVSVKPLEDGDVEALRPDLTQ